MKLLPYNDVNMGVEKLHIYDIDIYAAETKKISRFKVEDEIFKYLDKYISCLSSFSMAMSSYYAYTLFYFQFGGDGEDGKELESSLREMKEIYDKMEIVNKNKDSVNLSIINNERLETIHLEGISFYRCDLESIFNRRPSMDYDNYPILENLNRIKKCFEDNSTIHFTDAAKKAMEGIAFSYYENNKTINLLSKKIVITDDKGSLFTLPENNKMDIDEAERREKEGIEYSSRVTQKEFDELDAFEMLDGADFAGN